MAEQITIVLTDDPEDDWVIWRNDPKATSLFSSRGMEVAKFDSSIDYTIVQDTAAAIAKAENIEYAGTVQYDA